MVDWRGGECMLITYFCIGVSACRYHTWLILNYWMTWWYDLANCIHFIISQKFMTRLVTQAFQGIETVWELLIMLGK